MKWPYTVLVLIWLMIVLPVSVAAAPDLIVSKYINSDLFALDDQQLDKLSRILQTGGINTIATPVVWRTVEPAPENYDFSAYVRALDRLSAQGFYLILILDTSGREIIDQHEKSTRKAAVPDWLLQRFPEAAAQDFSGRRGFNLDYHDSRHRPALERFYHSSVEFFQRRYGEHIIAFVPGIMHELEIKYAQYGYSWQSYSAAAQQGFAAWLQQRGKTAAAMPVINYSNNLSNGAPHPDPLYAELMSYREHALQRYVCALTELIRGHGAAAAGYFGQSWTSHDAIYVVGIIEEVVDCFDLITVDYNYYDGWQVELNPYVLPLLVNYAYQLGYPRVIAGIYLERLYGADGRLVPAYLQTARKTVDLLQRQAPVGIELGNILIQDWQLLQTFDVDGLRRPRVAADQPSRYRVGLVVSKWTFYLWHGERSHQRNLLEDALYAAYRLLSEAADFSVSVLGERALLEQDLSRYDALLFAYQTTLSDAALDAVVRYKAAGGRLVYDLYFNRFDRYGQPRPDGAQALFGVNDDGCHNVTQKFIYRRQRIVLPQQPRNDCAYTTLSAAPGYTLTMPLFWRSRYGLMVRGARTLAFGFLPQLLEDRYKGDFWQQVYLDAIRELIDDPR